MVESGGPTSRAPALISAWAGHQSMVGAGLCLGTHPEGAGSSGTSWGRGGPPVSCLGHASLGLQPLWLFFHLLLAFALLSPYDLWWGYKKGQVTGQAFRCYVEQLEASLGCVSATEELSFNSIPICFSYT